MKLFKFGPWDIRPSEIFYVSKHSFGLVNLKPIVHGHVLVIPKRVVERFSQLTDQEIQDMFLSAQEIGKVIEREYQGESLTMTIQDGPAAGQTVAHVHIHLIPRRKGDWADNDDIYTEIDIHEHRLPQIIKERRSLSQVNSAASHDTVINPTNKTTVKESTQVNSKSSAGPDHEERPPRSDEEMAIESRNLRKFFQPFEDIWS